MSKTQRKEPTKRRTGKTPNRHSIARWHVKANAVATLAIILSIAGSQVLARNGSPPRLASADWSVIGPTSVAVRAPSLDEVQAFMNYLRQADHPVRYFRFANLRNTGTLSLVTCVDQGSGFDSYIDIIDKGPFGFTIDEIEQSTMASAGNDYSNLLGDLDGAGVYELIVQQNFSHLCNWRYWIFLFVAGDL